MEKFNASIADNPKVEMIQYSYDRSDSAAKEWAQNEGFPWLTVLPDDTDRSKLKEYHTSRGVPFYTMLDKDGNSVATGSGAIFSKIAEMSK